MPTSTPPSSAALAKRAAALCQEFKANDVVLLDLNGVTDMTDFFVIASGTSDTHARSIAERLIEELDREGTPVQHVEGITQGRWVLLDYVDFVVHVFHPSLREFFERLWSDAAVVTLDQQGAGT
jgi:ribosome-associated protein